MSELYRIERRDDGFAVIGMAYGAPLSLFERKPLLFATRDKAKAFCEEHGVELVKPTATRVCDGGTVIAEAEGGEFRVKIAPRAPWLTPDEAQSLWRACFDALRDVGKADR